MVIFKLMKKIKNQKIVVSGILKKENKILIARRPLTKKIAPGLYHLPGGHVEFGEHPGKALQREFWEEFKLPISTDDVVRVFSYQDDSSHTVGITYKILSEDIPKTIWFDPKDNDDVIWVKENEVKNFFSSDDHDYLTILKYFS